MKNVRRLIISSLLAVAIFLGSAGQAFAASNANITGFVGFLTATHGQQYAFTVKVTNDGTSSGSMYVRFDIPEDFQGEDVIVVYNNTGQTVTCSTPPFVHCDVNNVPVGKQIWVTYSGSWYNAGTFNAAVWSSDAFNGTQHDYVTKGPIVVS